MCHSNTLLYPRKFFPLDALCMVHRNTSDESSVHSATILADRQVSLKIVGFVRQFVHPNLPYYEPILFAFVASVYTFTCQV
jgi:hypothetical protein